MATFFGEVVEHPSRAFWDGHEDIDENEPEKGPVYKLNIVDKLENETYNYFIATTDEVSVGFASLYLTSEKSRCIATFEQIENDKDNVSTKQQIAAELHQFNDNILLLKCLLDIDIVNANELLLLVTPWLNKSREVAVFTCKSMGEYKTLKSRSVPETPFCRSLKTNQVKGDVLCPHLECPNAVTGFAASIVSWCQVKDQRAVLYIYYYSNQSPLSCSIGIEPLLNLCEKFHWYKTIRGDKPTEEEKSKTITIKSRGFKNSNLYT